MTCAMARPVPKTTHFLLLGGRFQAPTTGAEWRGGIEGG